MGAPLIHAAKTIGMIGVGNAEGGYNEEDLQALEALAPAVVQVLLRKRAEFAARVAEERLRHAQKMESIGVLAGGIAHDFNNLLVGVVGNASLADEMLAPGDPARPLLQCVVKSGEQAAYLTRQLLAYAGKGRFVLEPVDVSSVIDDAEELIRSCLPKKISVEFQLQQLLPEIEMDRSQMQQIIMNLVSNAAEAIGGARGRILVSTGTEEISKPAAHLAQWDIQPGQCVFLEVRDTGCGMDAATQARMFEPFFTTKFQGRGLGMSAVAGIVRKLNGAIRVDSSPGAGTCLRVLLPVTAGKRSDASPQADDQGALRGSGVVLMVDDEEVVREIAKTTLERHGYSVLAARSGAEAVEILKRDPGRVDLIILDLSMPGLSGEETLPKLRSIRPDIPVLVSSGYAERHALSGFAGTAVSGFIQKPYRSQSLAKAVTQILA